MSDPMTKVEIEDVLSSIRRLVSEDMHVPQPQGARRPDGAMTDAVRPVLSAAPRPGPLLASGDSRAEASEVPFDEDASDKDFAMPGPDHVDTPPMDAAGTLSAAPAPQPDPLVLTPQLRVAETDSASLRASLEETIAELEAAVSGAGDEWEAEGPAMVLDPADVPDLGAEITGSDNEHSEAAEPAPDTAEPSEGPVRLVSDTGDARPEALWSQYPETMEWAAPGDAAEESEEPAAGADLPGEGLDGQAADGEGLDLAHEDLGGVDPVVAAESDADIAERFWAAEAEDGALAQDPASLVTEPNGSPSPEDAADAEPPRRLHLAGGLGWGATPPVSAAGRGWLRSEPEDGDLLEAEEDDEDGLFEDAEDTVLDEAALRALVSEIIRQELQGTLGERITRSVRKLVRREIQRALAARDFD